MANPPFSGSNNSAALLRILPDDYRKSEFKDGGRQTGSTYISASKPDINAVPTAKPPFSGSRNSMELFQILPVVTFLTRNMETSLCNGAANLSRTRVISTSGFDPVWRPPY